jgi:hypothetical protein
VYDTPSVYCVWQNQTRDLTTRITLDFFVPEGDTFSRTKEQFLERGYEQEEIIAAAKGKFSLLAVYDDMTFDKPKADSQRLIYVMQKQ